MEAGGVKFCPKRKQTYTALWLTRECNLILRLTGKLASVLVHFFRFMVYLNYFENMTRVIIVAMNTT